MDAFDFDLCKNEVSNVVSYKHTSIYYSQLSLVPIKNSMVLNTLIFMYGAILVLSALIAGFLWMNYKHVLLKRLFALWGAGILVFLAQGLFNNLQFSGFLAFSLNWIPVLCSVELFSKASKIPLPLKGYNVINLFGFLISCTLFQLKFDYATAVGPFAVSNFIIMSHAALRGVQIGQKANYVNYGFCFLILLDGLHFLDYPFLRPNEGLAVIGFSITLCLFFCGSVYVPMFVLKKMTDDYTSDLKDEVSRRTLQLMESNQLLKESFDSLTMKNNQLEELSKRNQGLMSILVHDISNPLQVLIQNYDILFKYPEKFISELGPKSLRINKAIDSVSYILSEAKNLHVLSIGKAKPDFHKVPIGEALLEATDVFREHAKIKKITIQLNVELVKNTLVEVNIHWLKSHILGNLISNAIKFSPVGGTIHINAIPSDGNFVSVYIKDEGAGISSEKKSKLFDFDSITTSHGTNGEKGTGLGLPIVKQYVELMNGKIDLFDTETPGACFKVDLLKVDSKQRAS
jgi:signal transduction histidine kinase